MDSDNMVLVKRKNQKLSLVPAKTEEGTSSSAYSIDSIIRSLEVAEKADNHHKYAVHAERDYNLTNKWETLPIYEHGDHMPKMELFKNFKRTVNNVL